MQKIDNIEIKNFKSIRHQKIEGCKRINVFIGYPNVGKSNILEALSLASNFNNSGKSISLKDVCRFDELIGLYDDGNKQKQIELTISDFVYRLEYIDHLNVQYKVAEKGMIVAETSPDWQKNSKTATINDAGNFSKIAINRERKQPDIEIKKYQFKDLQNQVRNNPVKLDFPFGGNLSEVLRYNGELRKNCGELFKNYELKLAFDEDVKLKIQKQLDEYSVFQIPMIQVSDTLQRLIFHKAAIASNDNTVLLFEEPEAHMFPPYISKFTSDITYDENDNQFFLTTHSPFVINDFMENLKKDEYSIYTVGYSKGTGETLIRRMTHDELHEIYQYGVDLFLNLEHYLPQENNIHEQQQ